MVKLWKKTHAFAFLLSKFFLFKKYMINLRGGFHKHTLAMHENADKHIFKIPCGNKGWILKDGSLKTYTTSNVHTVMHVSKWWLLGTAATNIIYILKTFGNRCGVARMSFRTYGQAGWCIQLCTVVLHRIYDVYKIERKWWWRGGRTQFKQLK